VIEESRRHGAGPRARRSPSRRTLLRTAAAGTVAIAAAGTWLLWDNRRIVRTGYEVRSPRLPAAFDGFRIVQVSDLHSASFGAHNERLLDAVRGERPDLVAITGDIVDRTDRDPSTALDLAAALAQLAPTAYVTGNHEAGTPLLAELVAGLADRAVAVMRGASRALERAGERIRLIGIEDPRFPDPQETPGAPAGEAERTRGRLEDALARDPEGGEPWQADPFTVLLAHRPEQLAVYAEEGIDLALAGHAHGGQVRIPGIGGVLAPDQGLWPALTAGVARRGRTSLVISRGLGNSGAPVRVNDPPEIVTLTLRTA
jgi:predicted MPP superfamily phosphohydrolase